MFSYGYYGRVCSMRTNSNCFRPGRAGSTLNKSLGNTDLEKSGFEIERTVCVWQPSALHLNPVGPAGPKCKPQTSKHTSHFIIPRARIPRDGVTWGDQPEALPARSGRTTSNRPLDTTNLEVSKCEVHRMVCGWKHFALHLGPAGPAGPKCKPKTFKCT